MYAVSNDWVTAHEQILAPEGFVEISCHIPELNKTLVYTKGDLLSFTHTQTGDLVSGELPKNSIDFTLDNSDGKWNPGSPSGLERYLSERLKITLRYGFTINGVTEWIPGGVFYLTEWYSSPNGLEASFKARDALEYLIDKPYKGLIQGTLYELIESALAEAFLPSDIQWSLCDELKSYSVEELANDGSMSIAEIVQRCANAAGCVMYQDRDGVLTVAKLGYTDSGYTVPSKFSYTHPEFELSKPLKNVSVSYYGNASAVFHYSSSGETQTLKNDFIVTSAQAASVAKWVCDSLRSRKKITGSFRGDPRFDVFDVVQVEGKYGTVVGVVLTDITFRFTGAFNVTYTGYVHGTGEFTTIYSGEVFTGEVT
jgi:hypothetical protein